MMIKKFLFIFLLIGCVVAQGEMVNRYSFNDGDTTAVDTISAKDGTLTNTAKISGNKLVLDGSSSVELPSDILDPGLTAVTIEAWFQDDSTGNNWSRLFDFGETVNGGGGNAMFSVPQQYGNVRFTVATNGAPTWQTGEDTASATATPGQMTHVACVWDNDTAEIKIYLNGVLAETTATTMDLTLVARTNAFIGDSSYTGDPYFTGSIDEFRIYDTALTDDEVLQSYNDGPDVTLASDFQAKKATPKNSARKVSIDVGTLSWTPGQFVEMDGGTHNVFFGIDEANVAAATVADPMGTMVFEGLDVNNVSIARLAYDAVYYWRVDEVNLPANAGTIKGTVWKFYTEPEGIDLGTDAIIDVTAETPTLFYETQEPNMTCNGSGLDANDNHSSDVENTMWLGIGDTYGDTWIQYEFDQIYKFHEMLVWNYNEPDPGQWFGAKDVNITYSEDGLVWKTLGDIVQLNIADGADGYAANTTVALNGAVAKFVKITFLDAWMDGIIGGGLSEVRFSIIPTRVASPDPEDEATDIELDQVLSWDAGRGVVTHKLYIGSDANDVKAGIADVIADTDETMYSPVLELGKTYYWKVDEVNDNEAFSTWDGPVWSFSMIESILVEGFEEGYDDSDVNAVYLTWIDGYDDNSNGSVMGNIIAPYLSETAHSGDYSSPITYDHTTASYSEVTADSLNLPIASTDWAQGSPEALVIWFSGDPNNIPAQMYAKLNGTKILYDDDPIYLTKSAWRPWVIMLSDVSVNFSNITSITIGFDEVANQNEIGTILVDDISLYGFGHAPVIAEPVAPGTDGIIASYLMENNLQDSSGNGLNGTDKGDIAFVAGLEGYGMAIELDGGDSNDCVDLGLSEPNEGFNPEGSFSVALWANIEEWSSGWGNVMVGNRGESGVGWQVRRGADSHLCFTTRGLGNDDTYSNVDSPPLHEWVHIACVFDSEALTKSIYINGVLDTKVNLNTTQTSITTTEHNTYIGARATGDNSDFDSFFVGQLDEIYLYNRVLTAGEIAYLSDPTP